MVVGPFPKAGEIYVANPETQRHGLHLAVVPLHIIRSGVIAQVSITRGVDEDLGGEGPPSRFTLCHNGLDPVIFLNRAHDEVVQIEVHAAFQRHV